MEDKNPTYRLANANPGRYRCIELDEGAPGVLRLQQLGLCQDRELEVVACGNPMVVRVAHTEIGISKQLAETILVFD